MTKEEKTLVSLVKQEAKNIREYAFKSQINRLNIKTLITTSKYDCIYGQMTGHCESQMANTLIRKCCVRVYKSHDRLNEHTLTGGELNGAPEKIKKGDCRLDHYISPIEIWIYINRNNQQQLSTLVKYLKGEIKTLRIKYN